MRKFKLLCIIIVGLLVFVISCKSNINISDYEPPNFYKVNTRIKNNIEFSMSLIETGYAETLEAFVYSGGSLFKKRKLTHVSILIQHPKGNFVFDTGLGSNINNQVDNHFSILDRQLFKFTKLQSLKETLIENHFKTDSIDFIIPSHLHFDHASGIEDFPNADVWITKDEYNHAMGEKAIPPAFIKEQYDADFIKWKFFKFDNIGYELFNKSYDVFNDGTVVLVKLPGHTDGSLGMFVNLSSGARYFFTGDLTWAAEAFKTPSEKHMIPRSKVDDDREKVKKSIVKVHFLSKLKPEINIIPAHDSNAQKGIAHFPEKQF